MSDTPRPTVTISTPSGILVSLIPSTTLSQSVNMGIGISGVNTTMILQPN